MDIGETILFRHSKAGELCERFPFYIVLKKERLSGSIQHIGDGQCFL